VKVNNTNIFLVDGLGALTSAVMLGVVLPLFEKLIGMPNAILYALALIALCFAAYSLSCYFIIKPRAGRWLKGIVLANFLYCLVTALLVAYFFEEMTTLGIGYFLVEIIIILSLAIYEKRLIDNTVN
jgi:hypothetical protein